MYEHCPLKTAPFPKVSLPMQHLTTHCFLQMHQTHTKFLSIVKLEGIVGISLLALYLLIGHEERAHGTVRRQRGHVGVVRSLCREAAPPALPQVDEGLSPRLHLSPPLLRRVSVRGL